MYEIEIPAGNSQPSEKPLSRGALENTGLAVMLYCALSFFSGRAPGDAGSRDALDEELLGPGAGTQYPAAVPARKRNFPGALLICSRLIGRSGSRLVDLLRRGVISARFSRHQR